MRTFWFELFYLYIVWGLATYTKSDRSGLDSITIMLSTLFFILYFFLPLTKKRSIMFQVILLSLSFLAFLTFSSLSFNGFLLLILLIIDRKSTRLNSSHVAI